LSTYRDQNDFQLPISGQKLSKEGGEGFFVTSTL
jgi:hypothetical protein